MPPRRPAGSIRLVSRTPAAHQPPPRAARRRALALLAPILAALLAGCGSSHSSGTSGDPAAVVPGSAVLYLGADVRPTGAEESDALADGRSLTRQADPYLRLLSALQTPGSPPPNFEHEVASWLGPHAGVFLTSLADADALTPLIENGLLLQSSTTSAFPFGTSAAQGAIVLDTSDVGKARSFLEAAAGRASARSASYRGVSYQTTGAGVALGIVDSYAVLGSEAGLKAVVDTAKGGASLVDSPSYAKLIAKAPAGALAHLFSDPTGEAGAGGEASAASGLLGLLGGSRPSNISLLAGDDSLTIDADSLVGTTASSGGLLASGSEGAAAFGQLPGNSWLALGLAHLGTTLRGDVTGLGALASLAGGLGEGEGESSGLVSVKGLIDGLLTPLVDLASGGAKAQRLLTRWMGAGGIYASGTSLLEVRGAAVIESREPALSRAAVAVLGARLRAAGDSVSRASIPGTDAAIAVRVSGLPLAVYIANGRDAAGRTKFVLGLGEASVTAALDPPSTLAGSEAASSAAASLGGAAPSLLAEVPTLVGLLEGVGLSESPGISKVIPYLRAITTVVGGGQQLGEGVERAQIHVGLRPAG